MPVSEHEAVKKEAAADRLQNDSSQTPAAVLFLMQSAIEKNDQLAGSRHPQLAESNLPNSIKQLVHLHYALLLVP